VDNNKLTETDIIMKKVRVAASFPELPSGHHTKVASGEGTNIRIAINRALDIIFTDKHVKGRHLSGGTMRWNTESNGNKKDAASDE
jgi:hypothetical protein